MQGPAAWALLRLLLSLVLVLHAGASCIGLDCPTVSGTASYSGACVVKQQPNGAPSIAQRQTRDWLPCPLHNLAGDLLLRLLSSHLPPPAASQLLPHTCR